MNVGRNEMDQDPKRTGHKRARGTSIEDKSRGRGSKRDVGTGQARKGINDHQQKDKEHTSERMPTGGNELNA